MLPAMSWRRRALVLALVVVAGVCAWLSWVSRDASSTALAPPAGRPTRMDVALAAEYIRMQFPGSYDDMPDTVLIQKLMTKFQLAPATFDAIVSDYATRPVYGDGSTKYEKLKALAGAGAQGVPPAPHQRARRVLLALVAVGFVLAAAVFVVAAPPRSSGSKWAGLSDADLANEGDYRAAGTGATIEAMTRLRRSVDGLSLATTVLTIFVIVLMLVQIAVALLK